MDISFIDPNDWEVPTLLELSMGSPTPNKIREFLKAYHHPDYSLIGCRVEGQLAGILGAKMKDNMATIQAIAVYPTYRCQGIGKVLIEELLKRFAIEFLFAETDDEAVGFYEKCDFVCKAIEGNPRKRYACQRFQLLTTGF